MSIPIIGKLKITAFILKRRGHETLSSVVYRAIEHIEYLEDRERELRMQYISDFGQEQQCYEENAKLKTELEAIKKQKPTSYLLRSNGEEYAVNIKCDPQKYLAGRNDIEVVPQYSKPSKYYSLSPVARVHIKFTDSFPETDLEILDGSFFQSETVDLFAVKIDSECETCKGVGYYDERLGGEYFSNPKAECPDCNGFGFNGTERSNYSTEHSFTVDGHTFYADSEVDILYLERKFGVGGKAKLEVVKDER